MTICSIKIYETLGHIDSFDSKGIEFIYFGLPIKYNFKDVNILEIGRIDSSKFQHYLPLM